MLVFAECTLVESALVTIAYERISYSLLWARLQFPMIENSANQTAELSTGHSFRSAYNTALMLA